MEFSISLRVFEKRYSSENIGRAKQRLHVLLLRRQKYTQKEIASLVRVTQGTVSNVCRRFKDEGWDSVYDKPRERRPARLTKEQKAFLQQELNKEIVEDDIRRGWLTKDVKTFIKNNFNTTFTSRHLRRQLHAIGMSWKVPRPEHKKRDEKAVHTFKKTSPGRYCLWYMNTKSSA